MLMRKPLSVVTDNDGNIAAHITSKYDGYLDKDTIKFFYEPDEKLNTIEPM